MEVLDIKKYMASEKIKTDKIWTENIIFVWFYVFNMKHNFIRHFKMRTNMVNWSLGVFGVDNA